MARKLLLTDDLVIRIQARRADGVPYADLAREFSLGLSTVHRACRMPRPVGSPNIDAPPPKPPRPKKRKAKTDDVDVNPLELVKRVARDLDALRESAKAEGNAQATATMSRAITQALTLAAKLTPPTPPDPETQPDFLAAAARCRDKLREMVERELSRRRSR